MAMQNRFCALYYPYSRFLFQTDLKRALLVFDEIYFVDPLSKDISDLPGQYPVWNPQIKLRSVIDHAHSRFRSKGFDIFKWYDVEKTYKILKKKNIVKLIHPSDFIKDHEEILNYSVLNDIFTPITDKMDVYSWRRFAEWTERPPFGWKLHSSRIPESLKNLITNKKLLLEFVRNIKPNKEVNVEEIHGRLAALSSKLENIRRRL